ncbi:MAG: hypothetical protein H6834_05510 [Planctomycetes bacterium]|nr:hypothetical protein [Planctomycetota bacterium]MCB9890856.1 hypothetical protein [Planctomycetota bacterium]
MDVHPILILCPREDCRGAVRVDRDGIAQCIVCHTSLGVWSSRPTWAERPADPKDWDIQTVSLVNWPRRLAWAAAVLLTLSLGTWFALREPPTKAKEPAAATVAGDLTPFDLLEAVRTRKLPEGLELPAFYRDPTLIGTLKQSAFTSPSPLVKQWLLLSTREKVEILAFVGRDGDPGWLFAFLAEIAYSAIALEPDWAIADLIRSAIVGTSTAFAPIAIFLLDHMEQVCTHDRVRTTAAEDARDLRARLSALGH